MKTNVSRKKFLTIFLALNFVFFGLSVFETAAQTSKRVKRKTPVVQPVQNVEPAVVSRATDEQRIYVQPSDINQNAESSESATTEKPENQYNELSERIKSLETDRKKENDDKQKRLMLNLDILTRAEQRAETLRKQFFDMMERETQIRTKLEQIETDMRPEVLDRSVAFAGSLRPEELRDMRRKNLENERRNLQNLLSEIQNSKSSLETNVQKADLLVEKLRSKLEKEIDNALIDEPQNP